MTGASIGLHSSGDRSALPIPPHGPHRHCCQRQRDSNRPIDPELLRNHPGLWLRLIARCEIKERRAEKCLLMISAYTSNQTVPSRTETKVAGKNVRVTRATALIAVPSSFVPLLIETRTSLWP